MTSFRVSLVGDVTVTVSPVPVLARDLGVDDKRRGRRGLLGVGEVDGRLDLLGRGEADDLGAAVLDDVRIVVVILVVRAVEDAVAVTVRVVDLSPRVVDGERLLAGVERGPPRLALHRSDRLLVVGEAVAVLVALVVGQEPVRRRAVELAVGVEDDPVRRVVTVEVGQGIEWPGASGSWIWP